jgi:hypothetical protein
MTDLDLRLHRAGYKDSELGNLPDLYAAGFLDRDVLTPLLGLRAMRIARSVTRNCRHLREEAESASLLYLIKHLDAWPKKWWAEESNFLPYLDTCVRYSLRDLVRSYQSYGPPARQLRKGKVNFQRCELDDGDDDDANGLGIVVAEYYVPVLDYLDFRESFPEGDQNLFRMRAAGKSDRQIARETGSTPYLVKKKLTRLEKSFSTDLFRASSSYRGEGVYLRGVTA